MNKYLSASEEFSFDFRAQKRSLCVFGNLSSIHPGRSLGKFTLSSGKFHE